MDEMVTLEDGAMVRFRPIRPDDEDQLERLFFRLSPDTVYLRFLSPVRKPRRSLLHHLANVDYVDRYAVVAEIDGDVVGVARFDRVEPRDRAEIAVLVEDAWQGRHIGPMLLDRLGRVAWTLGVREFTATMLAENRRAVRLANTGRTSFTREAEAISAVIPLQRGA